MSEAPDAEFSRGIELFNSCEYYDCHEVLEHYWKDQPEPDRQLTQAIIQIAVALYHAGRGNLEGTRRLLRRALGRLDGTEGIAEIGIRAHVDAVKLRQDAALALQAAETDNVPSNFPLQLL